MIILFHVKIICSICESGTFMCCGVIWDREFDQIITFHLLHGKFEWSCVE